MKSVLCVLALVAAASALGTFQKPSSQHAEVLADLQEAMTLLKDFQPMARTLSLPSQFSVASSKPKTQDACGDAFAVIIQDYMNCPAMQTAGQTIFQQGAAPNQTTVAGFCGAACVATFKADLGTFLQACTPLQVVAIEITYHIRFYDLIFALNVPCVQDPTNPGTYCLPIVVAAFKKADSFGKGGPVQDSDLAPPGGLCSPCMAAWAVELFKYAPINDLFVLQYLGVLCSRSLDQNGNTVWCIPSFAASTVACNGGLSSTCLTKICADNCYQKIIIKLYLANPAAANNTQANVANLLFVLDLACTSDPNLGYCGNVLQNLDNTGPALFQACANDYGQNVCGSACKQAGTTFLQQTGCYFQTLVAAQANHFPVPVGQRPDITNPNQNLQAIDFFLKGTCNLNLPDICPLNRFIQTAVIVVRNIEWNAYITAAALVQEALILDVAGYLGARETQIELLQDMLNQPKQVQAIQASELQSAAPSGVQFSFNINQDNHFGSAQITANADDAHNGLNYMPLPQLGHQGSYGFQVQGYQDQGYTVDASLSSVSAQQTGAAVALLASPLVLLAAIVAALLL